MPFNYKTELHRYKRYYQSIERIAAKPHTQAYTATIFSFLAVSLFGWYAIRPTVQTILYLRREIADNGKVNRQMEEKIEKLIEAHATYQSIQEDLPLLSQALPKEPDILTALSHIRTIVQLHGASVSAITSASSPLMKSPERSTAKPNSIPKSTVESVQVTVNASGTYENLRGIIEDVTAMRRLVTITAMNFSADPESTDLNLVLKLNAHYIDR